jgi:mannose-6-phosphate isomerase-like protein (cupin superfamily)
MMIINLIKNEMKRIKSKLGKALLENEFFKKILHTSRYLQIASLRLKPGAQINLETHESMDQFFGFKGGKGKCTVEGRDYFVENGDVIIIPAGSRDEVVKFDCHKKAKSTNDFFNFNQKIGAGNKTKNALKRIS